MLEREKHFDKNETKTEEEEGVRRVDKSKEEESKVPSRFQSRQWSENEEVATVVPLSPLFPFI